MTKLVFSKKRFNSESKAVLDQIIPIVQTYQEQRYSMTLFYEMYGKQIAVANKYQTENVTLEQESRLANTGKALDVLKELGQEESRRYCPKCKKEV